METKQHKQTKPVRFLAFNRSRKTVCDMPGFICWEHLQGAFRCGIIMPDGKAANGIGRYSGDDLAAAAKQSGLTLI